MAVAPGDVKVIIDTDLSDTEIESYISDAETLLNNLIGSAEDLVQKWVAAHLIAYSRERQIKQGEAAGTGATYTGVYTQSLMATSYGQTAISMDTTGKLSEAATQKSAKLSVIDESYS